MLNCGFGIGKRFELLSSKSWTIKNQQYKNAELKNVEHADSILQLSHSKILAYNNNTLDKMILAHAYQQSFGEVFILTRKLEIRMFSFLFYILFFLGDLALQFKQYLEDKSKYFHALTKPRNMGSSLIE